MMLNKYELDLIFQNIRIKKPPKDQISAIFRKFNQILLIREHPCITYDHKKGGGSENGKF